MWHAGKGHGTNTNKTSQRIRETHGNYIYTQPNYKQANKTQVQRITESLTESLTESRSAAQQPCLITPRALQRAQSRQSRPYRGADKDVRKERRQKSLRFRDDATPRPRCSAPYSLYTNSRSSLVSNFPLSLSSFCMNP